MLLEDVLAEMSQQGKCSGDTSFELLALVGTNLGKRTLTFIDSFKYVSEISENFVVLTSPKFAHKVSTDNICITKEPRLLYFKIHNYLAEKCGYRRNRTETKIGNSCNINSLSSIAKDNVIIGNNVTIEEFVSIKEGTVIGNNCLIGAGSVIGGKGLAFQKTGDFVLPISHIGGVILGNNVEVQQQCVVENAIYPWDNTEINEGSKIGNLCVIGHAVRISKRVLIAGNSLVGGRTTIGNDAWIGPSTTITNGISIGDSAKVNIGAVVVEDVADRKSVTGNFAVENILFLRNQIKQFKRLS